MNPKSNHWISSIKYYRKYIKFCINGFRKIWPSKSCRDASIWRSLVFSLVQT